MIGREIGARDVRTLCTAIRIDWMIFMIRTILLCMLLIVYCVLVPTESSEVHELAECDTFCTWYISPLISVC
jgi:hypothetical protein